MCTSLNIWQDDKAIVAKCFQFVKLEKHSKVVLFRSFNFFVHLKLFQNKNLSISIF